MEGEQSVKAIMGGSWVVGDGRLWRDGTREARRPARRKRRKDTGTALREEQNGLRRRASAPESEHP